MVEILESQIKIKEKSTSAYRTIGEVSEILDLPQHILRFWEAKFSQIAPHKNKGRRYYTPNDISVLKKIKHLLYEQGLTIKGVKQYLENKNTADTSLDISPQLNLINNIPIVKNDKREDLINILGVLKRSKEKLLSMK